MIAVHGSIYAGVTMTYKEIAALNKTSVPRGKEAEYAALIKKYILHKSKLTRAFMIAFSAFVAACVLFIAIARAAEISADYPAVFWSVTAVLAAAAAVCAVCAAVNMFAFRRFLKKFE